MHAHENGEVTHILYFLSPVARYNLAKVWFEDDDSSIWVNVGDSFTSTRISFSDPPFLGREDEKVRKPRLCDLKSH